MESLSPRKGRYADLKNVAENFSLRLKELIRHQSIRSFARSCNLSETALRKYLNGESTPNIERLIAIANYADVSVEWLATGAGQKQTRQIAEPSPLYQANSNASFIEVEREMLLKLISHTQARLNQIEHLAQTAQQHDVWHANKALEEKVLADLKANLAALDT